MNEYQQATQILKNARRTVAFTGAGISVESGIPPFRGENGLWSRYDPVFLDMSYFQRNPKRSWELIKEIFYDYFGQARPNEAHIQLAELEREGMVHNIITQNIDNLHQEAGSKSVVEFHGTSRHLVCMNCAQRILATSIDLAVLPPKCPKCGAVLKPDFIFFGEPIPPQAYADSFTEAKNADVFLLIGTTGEIMPASLVPQMASRNKATIIEINVEPSNYTRTITNVFLRDKATVAMKKLAEMLSRMTMG